MNENEPTQQFEEAILPHLDAAYNLARWLAGNDQDAQDVVQDACVRALRFFGGFRGGNSRAWLLTIVRNTFYNSVEQNRSRQANTEWVEDLDAVEDQSVNPELLIARSSNVEIVQKAIGELPVEFREIIVLRELEGCSYKEIADVTGVPIGTVMSRLARARRELQKILSRELEFGNRQ